MRWLVSGLCALVTVTPCYAQNYQVGAGDTVNIEVFEEKGLSRESLVPTHCTVDVALIGAVQVCARTTDEIAKDVRDRLANGYLVNPNVIVAVTKYGSQKIEVRGAVKQPGIQILTGTTLLSQAITSAGGPDGENVVEVELIKPNGGGGNYLLSKLNDPEAPILVTGGDTVIVRQGRHVYVDGEVEKEGSVPYREGLTVSQAVSLAGGPGLYASLRRVSVLKPDGQRQTVNLMRVREGKDEDLKLGPDDRVTIRRSYL